MKKSRGSVNISVDTIKKDFEEGRLTRNGEYQRYGDAWNSKQQSALIYAMIQGYPIGEMIRNQLSGITRRYEIVDGLQRITAITSFLNGAISLTAEDSKKILQEYSDQFSVSIQKRFNQNKSIKLKYKSLPDNMRFDLERYEITTVTLFDWNQEDVIEYFRMVQNGKRLTHADTAWTINNDLTSKLKVVSENKNYLNSLGLIFDKGKAKSGGDRLVYKSALEAIYSKIGKNIGEPSKLTAFFNELAVKSEHIVYVEKIEAFLSTLKTSDKIRFIGTGMATNLKLIFCLVLHGDFKGDLELYKDFIINVVLASTDIKTARVKGNKESQNKMYNTLNKLELSSYFTDYSIQFNNFSELRAGAHNSETVKNACLAISDIYNKMVYQEDLTIS